MTNQGEHEQQTGPNPEDVNPLASGDSEGGAPRGGVFTPAMAAMQASEDDGLGDPGASAGGKGNGAARYAVVAGVLLLGAGLLYVMRQIGAGPKEAAASVEIDYAFVDGEQREAAEQQRQAIADLSRSGPPSQLPANAIPRNPFLLMPATATTESGPAVAVDTSPAISMELGSLELQAVLEGRVPVARISGQTVREGDRVGEHFLCVEIKDRGVVLRSELGDTRIEMGDDG